MILLVSFELKGTIGQPLVNRSISRRVRDLYGPLPRGQTRDLRSHGVSVAIRDEHEIVDAAQGR